MERGPASRGSALPVTFFYDVKSGQMSFMTRINLNAEFLTLAWLEIRYYLCWFQSVMFGIGNQPNQKFFLGIITYIVLEGLIYVRDVLSDPELHRLNRRLNAKFNETANKS